VQGQQHISPRTKSLWNTFETLRFVKIQDELQALSSMFAKTYIILDALDECPTVSGVRRQLLECLFSLHGQTGINILATSRPNEEICKYFVSTGAIWKFKPTTKTFERILTTEHFTFQVLFLKSLVCKNTFEKRL
jgi:hypothetical protein